MAVNNISSVASQRMTLFCLPHAGSGLSAYRGWVQDLESIAEVVPLQLPGREGRFRESLFNDIRAAVEDHARIISESDQRPYALFGNSLGGLIAYELAHEMERRSGRPPVHLFIASAAAPHLPRPWPPIRHLPDREFVETLNGRYGGVPQAILDDREMLAALVPAMRGDLTIFETYTYETKGVLPCPISVFGGRRDSSLSVKSLEGWGEHTQSGFHLQLFDAGHLFLQTHRPAIARYVRGVIEKALIVSARTGDSS